MRNSKKGSLNLSINAIVILILSITILGLGLAFISNVFGTATEQFDEVKGDARKQMITLMEDTDDVVALSRLTVDIKQGETKQIFIAFKNTGDNEETFSTLSVTGQALKGTDADANCADYNDGFNPVTPARTYIEFKDADTKVVARDVVVLPLNIVATNPSDDVCYFEISTTHNSVEEKIALTVEII
jgi:hypothetical protein